MFSGINVIVDKDFGILREFLVAPVPRLAIPLANALAVLTIALVQVTVMMGLGTARGAEFNTSACRAALVRAGASLSFAGHLRAGRDPGAGSRPAGGLTGR